MMHLAETAPTQTTKRRLFEIGVWLAALALTGLAGCGGGGGASEAPAGAASAPATAASDITVNGPEGSSLFVPAGATTAPVTYRIAKDSTNAPVLPSIVQPAGDVFTVTPGGLALLRVATLRIPFDPSTPDDAPIALVESNGDGTWTLRPDARLNGNTLEITVLRLGQYQAVRPAAAATSRAAGVRPARQITWVAGISIAAAGYVDGSAGFGFTSLPSLSNPTPYPGPASVRFTVRAYTNVGSFCPTASSIEVDQVAFSGSLSAGIVETDTTPISPAQAGPWAVDLKVFQPLGGPSAMLAFVTVKCTDAFGNAYSVRADRVIQYAVETKSLQMSAANFVEVNQFGVTGLLNPTAYASPGTASVTIQSTSDCPLASGILVEYYDSFSTVTIATAAAQQQTPIAPPSAGPWTFDLRIYAPAAGQTSRVARVTLQCVDGSGNVQGITAGSLIAYATSFGPTALGFLAQPADQSVLAGQGASFDVRVTGGAAQASDRDQYRLFWEKSGDGGIVWQTIGTSYQSDAVNDGPAAGRRESITLSAVTAADNGSVLRARACYAAPGQIEQCITSASARLTVAQAGLAPSILRQPQSIATLVGETASFSVGVAGTPAPRIQWQVLGAAAGPWLDVGSAGATWPGARPNATTLVTFPATADQDGWLFRVVASNAAGSVTSDAVVWRVSDTLIAPTIDVQPQPASVAPGASALFAIVAEGTAPLSYQWSMDGVAISGANSPILSVANVQTAQLGNYRVVVSGPGGSVTSDPAALTQGGQTIVAPPVISAQPAPRSVALGQTATFNVTVGGGPPVSCGWTRNGVPIAGASDCASYTTPPTGAVDNGAVYNIVAFNSGGTVLGGGAVLTVQGTVTAATWTFLPTGVGTPIYDIALVGGDPDRIVAVCYDGTIIRSTDGGATWARVFTPADTVRFLVKVRFVDANVGLAIGPSDIVRTTDGGATWTVVWHGEDYVQAYGYQTLQAVDWIDANTAMVVSLGRVWRSTDRGATWAVFGDTDFRNSSAGVFHALRFGNAQLGLATSDYNLFRTTDGGMTWAEVPGKLSTFIDPLYGLGRGSTDQIWEMAGGNGLYRSTDGGVTWTRTGIGGYLISLAARGSEQIAAGDNGLIMHSVDDGLTWTSGPNVPFGQIWSVDFAQQRVFVSGIGGLVARQN
ncbi:MAG: YCF48-related protein [Caldimonas sp.]